MKKIAFSLFLLALSWQITAQTAKEFFLSTEQSVTWLGVDFSQVKIIGDFSHFSGAGFQSGESIRDEFFKSWNNVVLAEPEKYNVKEMLRKSEVEYDISIISKVNATANVENIEAFSAPNYTEEQVQKWISNYPLENKEGYGIVFLAESLNKNAKEAIYHVSIINMKTKEIVIYEKIKSEPAGFGLRNYWAGSIYRTMKQVKDTHYKKWKAKHK